jgi:DNA-binding Lrp family transcriptional regulator
MVLAFVLIKAKSGSELHVYSRLTNEPEIKEVYPIFGEFDFLIKIISQSFEIIGDIIFNKIRVIDGVVDTITLHEAKLS